MTGTRIHWLKAEGKVNAEKTRGAARQLWMRVLMEASYELKFELQVQVNAPDLRRHTRLPGLYACSHHTTLRLIYLSWSKVYSRLRLDGAPALNI
jgi:hypothetical protein